MLNKLRLHGLRMRVLITLLTIGVVAVGVTTIFARQGTADVFYQFIDQNTERDQGLVVGFLRDASASGELDQAQVERLGRDFNIPIMLVSASGDVLAASNPQTVGVAVALPPPECGPVVMYQAEPTFIVLNSSPSGDVVRWAAEAPPPAGILVAGGTATRAPIFINSINQSFGLAAGLALGLATVLSLGLSRQIIRPVEALTTAARRMEKGDLSQRVAVNSRDEIGELAHAFNAMADGLQRADQSRRDMVSDVAHELRTPLANVRGYLEAIRDGVLQPERSVIESLHEETLILNRLIDDLQELALADAGQLTLRRQPTALSDLITRVAAATGPQATDKGLTLRLDLAPDLPTLDLDPARIAQALRNLIVNAIAHTATSGEIVVSAAREESRIAIRVRDTGEGIAPEHLPFVFERFYRGDPSRSRSTGGSGLGLAIVKQWVTAHTGEVSVESEVEKGTTFTIVLPISTV